MRDHKGIMSSWGIIRGLCHFILSYVLRCVSPIAGLSLSPYMDTTPSMTFTTNSTAAAVHNMPTGKHAVIR